MISGPVPFDEIVQAVADQTGITNIRNYIDRIRRLLFRAERKIGYGGSVVLKRCVLQKNINGFNGQYVKFPEDYIEFEGIGDTVAGHRIMSRDYVITSDGIRLRCIQDKVTLLYWGLSCDGYGNPITTRNHEEAVIAFIVWQLYQVRRFVDKGNANTNIDYEMRWERYRDAARGEDAWPTLDEFNELAMLSYADRRGLLQQPTASYSYAADSAIPDACCGGGDGPTPPVPVVKVYYWQFSTPATTIEDLIEEFGEETLEDKPSQNLSVFELGTNIGYTQVGRIVFAISKTTSQHWLIFDALSNDVTTIFDTYYDETRETMIFVSKAYYTHSSIYFKFKNLQP